MDALDEAIKAAPEWGICPIVFRAMKDQVKDIIAERDAYRDKLCVIAGAMEAMKG